MKKTKGCPQPLGAVRMGERTNFAVAVPAGKSCELLLYRTGAVKPEAVFEMPEGRGTWGSPFSGGRGDDWGKL